MSHWVKVKIICILFFTPVSILALENKEFSATEYLLRLKSQIPESYHDLEKELLIFFEQPIEVKFESTWNFRWYPIEGQNGKIPPGQPQTNSQQKYRVVAIRKTKKEDRFLDHNSVYYLGILQTDHKVLWVHSGNLHKRSFKLLTPNHELKWLDEKLSTLMSNDKNDLPCSHSQTTDLSNEMKEKIKEHEIIIQKIIPAIDKKCKKPENCQDKVISKQNPSRYKYDQFIFQAAEKHGLPFALVKSVVASETTFGPPHIENLYEKNKFITGKSKVKWGRGLGMFGEYDAGEYNLAWYQTLGELLELNPELKNLSQQQLYKERMRKKLYLPGEKIIDPKSNQEILIQSVFNSKAAIEAMAKKLKDGFKKYSYSVNTIDKNDKFTRINPVLSMELHEQYRIAIAAYNRGTGRVHRSIESFVSNHSKTTPKTYVDIAFTQPALGYSTNSVLIGHPQGHCYVWKTIGFCNSPGGFFKEFLEDEAKLVRGFAK